jgi:hypothetical protein
MTPFFFYSQSHVVVAVALNLYKVHVINAFFFSKIDLQFLHFKLNSNLIQKNQFYTKKNK